VRVELCEVVELGFGWETDFHGGCHQNLLEFSLKKKEGWRITLELT